MIRVSNLSFSYKDKKILRDINFEIKDGEFILIVGDNASGKTTLLKCINGLIPHYTKGYLEGSVLIDNIDVSKLPIWEISQKVGTLLQDFQHQIFSNIVKDELMLMLENFGVEEDIAKEKVYKIASMLKIENILDKKTSELSQGQMQKTALGSILTPSPDILLLDEPTSNIDKESTFHLLDILSQLKHLNKTIIVVDHNYKLFLSMADRIFFLKDGSLNIFNPSEYNNIPEEEFDINLDKLCLSDKEIILECNNLSFSYDGNAILNNVSFTLKKLECLGIVGENGSGKTTLGKIVANMIPKEKGNIISKAKNIKMVLPNQDIQLFFDSIEKEIFFNAKSEDIALDILKEFGFMAFKNKHPYTLSYGQKQMLAIGSSLASYPDILILDEPTSSLSGEKKIHLAYLLGKYQVMGLSIVILGHDISFLKVVCNRIMNLERGKLVEIYEC